MLCNLCLNLVYANSLIGKKVHNPVSAILAEAGISYTHENSEVIGTSKVEAQISKRAIETTKDADMGDVVAFGSQGISGERFLEGYRFNPPIDIMRRQFCTMAKIFGIEDVREFALVVEGWTQKQRREALDKFYKMRRDMVVKRAGVKLRDIQSGEASVMTESGKGPVHTEIESGDDEL